MAESKAGWGDEGQATAFIVDYVKSHGVYVTDIDGNTMLDCFGQIASLPLGFDHFVQFIVFLLCEYTYCAQIHVCAGLLSRAIYYLLF